MAIEEFGRRQILSQRHINNIELIFEELCVQTLLGRMGDEIRLGFAVEVSEVSEADESCLVTVTYGGNAFKPLMGCSDSLSRCRSPGWCASTAIVPEWKQSDEPASVRECITDII